MFDFKNTTTIGEHLANKVLKDIWRKLNLPRNYRDFLQKKETFNC